MNYAHPTELANHLVFLSMIDAHFSDEFGTTCESAFAEAREALEHFVAHTSSDEGKAALEQCMAHLQLALEELQNGHSAQGSLRVQQVEALFRRCSPLIELADE